VPTDLGSNRHHYLSQVYLRRWTAEVTPPREPYVFLYRRGEAEPERGAPKNVAVLRGFYEIPSGAAIDGDREHVEKWLSTVESGVAHAFAYVDEHGRLDERPHIDSIALFVATQMVRTPRFLRGLEARLQECASNPRVLVAMHGGVPTLRHKLRLLGAPRRDLTNDKILRFVAASARHDAVHRERRVGRIPEVIENSTRHLRSMQWDVVEAASPEQFITSDHPVLVPTAIPGRPWWEPPSAHLFPRGIEVWLPLDPGRALVARRTPAHSIAVLPAHDVRRFNERLATQCHQFVIAHRPRPRLAGFMASLPSTSCLDTTSGLVAPQSLQSTRNAAGPASRK
jgi:hypothetical protein